MIGPTKNNYSIKITNHALERAKQRLNIININKNTLEYEFKLIELIKYKATFFYEQNHKLIYKMVYDNNKYKIVINPIRDNILLIETIIKI